MTHQILSLFCGAGGLDYGFHQAGFETVLALDKCPQAVRSFNANFRNAAVAREADLSSLKPDDFLSLVPPGSRPVGLIGGPPCQGFSRGNVTADPHDPRNRLLFRYVDLVAAANRKYKLHFFVFENVAELAGPKHRRRFGKVLARLGRAGFRVFPWTLNAADYGVPQRRRRLFIVGLNSSLYPDVTFTFPAGTAAVRHVRDAIEGLPRPRYYERGLKSDEIEHHPNHWTLMPKSAKFTSGQSSDGRSFKRLNWDEVSPTVAYGNREIHVHPDGGRRLSVLEAMLLQGFPPEYTLEGTLSSQVTQVSNAVPPPVAEAIGRALRTLVESSNGSGRVDAISQVQPGHRQEAGLTAAGGGHGRC